MHQAPLAASNEPRGSVSRCPSLERARHSADVFSERDGWVKRFMNGNVRRRTFISGDVRVAWGRAVQVDHGPFLAEPSIG